MDLWHKARNLAEEFTVEAAKLSQELTIGSSRLSDVVSEASKHIAAEASKRSKEILAEASKRADQIKFQIPLKLLVDSPSSSQTALAAPNPDDLEKFGITDDLKEFVKGITRNTFQNFQPQDESEMSDIPTVSNIRQDLMEFQEKHAKLVLSSVKEISKLRYEICPRIMRERKFWRVYFILVNSHLAPYEKKYMDEAKIISAEKENVEETENKPVMGATTQTNKKAASSTADHDLDVFLLGEDSDEEPDDGENAFDDDFDKI